MGPKNGKPPAPSLLTLLPYQGRLQVPRFTGEWKNFHSPVSANEEVNASNSTCSCAQLAETLADPAHFAETAYRAGWIRLGHAQGFARSVYQGHPRICGSVPCGRILARYRLTPSFTRKGLAKSPLATRSTSILWYFCSGYSPHHSRRCSL